MLLPGRYRPISQELAPPLSWEGRDNALRSVLRYGVWEKMFYRTNLKIHTERLLYFFEDHVSDWAVGFFRKSRRNPFSFFREAFDPAEERVYLKHHDDFELDPILGDVTLREKLTMTKEELFALRELELKAVETITRIWPRTVEGYNVRDLLLQAIRKDRIVGQLGSVIDKVDGFCEALHEVLAGNVVFLEAVINYYTHTFNDLPGKYPLIKRMFSDDRNPFTFPVCDLWQLFEGGARTPGPHTRETIACDTGIPLYEMWKRTTIKHFGYEPLIRQTEFYPPRT